MFRPLFPFVAQNLSDCWSNRGHRKNAMYSQPYSLSVHNMFLSCNRCCVISVLFLWAIAGSVSVGPFGGGKALAEPRSVSGIYPHLAYVNPHGECGTGAVVPWADKLWVITYGPHFPQGSADKLYSIDAQLNMEVFAKSVGGTPANRMIHRETNQLVIGPYVIDAQGGVQVIPPTKMYGRLTGNARHLFEPEKKVYFATMEEGIYEVDVETLEVTELFRDNQKDAAWGGTPNDVESTKPAASVPGYHGKGLYSGQGRLIYANNGESSRDARRRPDVPSGCLAEWDGKSEAWTVIRRNQFTDIRGPGGIYGNPNPETDPVWAIGWDHRSLILMLLDGGEWYTYRMPKATHTYDGAHGWNTEWPRFQDIGEDDFVLNMHGMFWRFPRTFSRAKSGGIEPRSTYLKVVGDYTPWKGGMVFGCDDTAKTEFLNTRRAKGKLGAPGISNSNLWFTGMSIFDELGPQLGRGSLYVKEDIPVETPSDPYLFAGFARRCVHLAHKTDKPVDFVLEVDLAGDNQWTRLDTVTVPAGSAAWHSFDSDQAGAWIRVSTQQACQGATVAFQYSGVDNRSTTPDSMFQGLATAYSSQVSGGLLRVRGDDGLKLSFAAQHTTNGEVSEPTYYELDGELQLRSIQKQVSLDYTLNKFAIPEGVLSYDAASCIYVDDNDKRWRLPRGSAQAGVEGPLGPARVDREVVTERDLFNCGGLFYELPARNAGGFAVVRPICTHNTQIKDYCSYRGMLILSGVEASAEAGDHVIRSEDGEVALWAGTIDDLWKFGKPTGIGGPWLDSPVEAGEPSDPYLMTGFDKKTVSLSHEGDAALNVTLQVDITGTGNWVDFKTYEVSGGQSVTETLPESFAAYWVRALADRDGVASVQFRYE